MTPEHNYAIHYFKTWLAKRGLTKFYLMSFKNYWIPGVVRTCGLNRGGDLREFLIKENPYQYIISAFSWFKADDFLTDKNKRWVFFHKKWQGDLWKMMNKKFPNSKLNCLEIPDMGSATCDSEFYSKFFW